MSETALQENASAPQAAPMPEASLFAGQGLVRENTSEETQQYLSFHLESQEYAVDILRVQEIREWMPVTPVPNTRDCVRGVMNLRGAVVPVIDLRLRLGLPPASYTPQTVVVVLHVFSDEVERTMGVVVDAVAEVYDLNPAQITPPPEITAQGLQDAVRGLVQVGGRLITILDFDRLLTTREMVLGP